MAQRSKIKGYPPEIRAWLDAELIRRGFSDYVQLAADLVRESAQRGTPVEASKSGLQRYGARLEQRLSAIKASTEAAKLIVAQAPDDAGERESAVISMIQTEIMDVLIALQDLSEADPMKRAKLLSTVAKNVATLTRASIHQKKHEIEIRARASAAADKVARMAKRGGLSAGAIDNIRREILGIST